MPIFVVIVAAMALLPWGLLERWPTPAARAWAFPVLAAVAGLFLLALGRAMTGRWAGILIDRHNTVSLARLQLVLWSLLVLSAFAVGGIANVLGVGTLTAAQLAVLGLSDSSAYAALDIQVPTELLGALGLAGAAAVAGPLIVNTKMQIQPSAQDQQA